MSPDEEAKLYYPMVMSLLCEQCGYKMYNTVEAVDSIDNLNFFINHKHLEDPKPESKEP